MSDRLLAGQDVARVAAEEGVTRNAPDRHEAASAVRDLGFEDAVQGRGIGLVRRLGMLIVAAPAIAAERIALAAGDRAGAARLVRIPAAGRGAVAGRELAWTWGGQYIYRMSDAQLLEHPQCEASQGSLRSMQLH